MGDGAAGMRRCLAHEMGHGVDGEVAAGGVSGAHTAVGVGGTVGLALEEHLAVEIIDGLAVLVELEQGLVHLGGETVADAGGGHGLEPVAVDGGAVVGGPVEDSLGDDVSLTLLLGPGGIVEELVGLAVLLEVLLGDAPLKQWSPKPSTEVGLVAGMDIIAWVATTRCWRACTFFTLRDTAPFVNCAT